MAIVDGTEKFAKRAADAALQEEIKQSKIEKLSKLPQYAGEVQSKTSLRKLPNLKKGDIFWINMDHMAYVVTDLDKKKGKCEIKSLDENATISTGLTYMQLNKQMSRKEPLLIFDEAINIKIEEWFENNEGDYFLLYGRDMHYFTFFHRTRPEADRKGFNFIEMFKALLPLPIVSIDFDTIKGGNNIEIWVRDEKEDYMLYLFNYNNGVVDF